MTFPGPDKSDGDQGEKSGECGKVSDLRYSDIQILD